MLSDNYINEKIEYIFWMNLMNRRYPPQIKTQGRMIEEANISWTNIRSTIALMIQKIKK